MKQYREIMELPFVTVQSFSIGGELFTASARKDLEKIDL